LLRLTLRSLSLAPMLWAQMIAGDASLARFVYRLKLTFDERAYRPGPGFWSWDMGSPTPKAAELRARPIGTAILLWGCCVPDVWLDSHVGAGYFDGYRLWPASWVTWFRALGCLPAWRRFRALSFCDLLWTLYHFLRLPVKRIFDFNEHSYQMRTKRRLSQFWALDGLLEGSFEHVSDMHSW